MTPKLVSMSLVILAGALLMNTFDRPQAHDARWPIAVDQPSCQGLPYYTADGFQIVCFPVEVTTRVILALPRSASHIRWVEEPEPAP